MDIGAIEMTSVAEQGCLRSTSFLAALGAAAILMTGCSEESVSPTAPSPVGAVAPVPATASSASADGVSPAGLLEPGRVQTAPGAEAEDTFLARAAASQAWPPAETAVTNLRAEPDESDLSLTLSWDPPTYETNFQIRDYRYRIDYQKWLTVSSNARSVLLDTTFDSINPGQRHRFQVRARFGTRSNGFAGRKATIWETAPGGAVSEPPALPFSLSHEFIGDIVHLTWTISSTSSEVLRWEVRVGPNGQWWSTNSTRPGWA